MNNIFKLTLGGKERNLLFGTGGFFNYVGDASKIDPLEWLRKLDGQRGIIDSLNDVAIIVYAGVNCYNDAQDSENVSFDKVRKWVNALSSEDMTEVSTFAFTAFPQKQEVEEEKKTMALI